MRVNAIALVLSICLGCWLMGEVDLNANGISDREAESLSGGACFSVKGTPTCNQLIPDPKNNTAQQCPGRTTYSTGGDGSIKTALFFNGLECKAPCGEICSLWTNGGGCIPPPGG